MSEHDEKDKLFSAAPPVHNNSGILERVAIHPLASEDEESRASSSINTSSLIESAARSILDDKSPSTAISDDESCADGAFRREQLSPTLRSLQRETLPAVPDEQDRKRFVGCLAAILACTYDYDRADESDDQNDVAMAENMAYLSMSEHDGNEFEDDDDPLLFDTVTGSFEYSEASGTVDADSSPHRPSQASWRRGTRQKGIQARNRHRKRRYDVLSGLLLDSSEYLMLDKSQAKAFLPMLSKLLVPESKEGRGSRGEERPSMWQRTPSKSKRSSSNGSTQTMLERISGAPVDDFGASRDILARELDEIEYLRPFLESMAPGAGFRCVSLLLLQYLLHSQEGYDARIRYAIRTLGVLALAHDMEMDPVESHAERADTTSKLKKNGSSRRDLVALATRKFESLEHFIAAKLILLSREQEKLRGARTGPVRKTSSNDTIERQRKGYSRDQIMRGIKVGGAGLVAGTLFAVTGGLAAPGIAAGVAAFAGGTAATAAAAAILTSTAAVTAIFGVGGGSLAAYKMQRRTQGLTEFEFRKESGQQHQSHMDGVTLVEAELFCTICLSGWLRDECDFQRPWGVDPSYPPLANKLELLERFYSVHSPDHVAKSSRILASWKGEEEELWNLLRQKYGRDPDHLFPLDEGIRYRGGLTLEQEEILDQLFVELGFASSPKAKGQSTPFERMRVGWKKRFQHPPRQQDVRSRADPPQTVGVGHTIRDSLHGPHINDVDMSGSLPGTSSTSSGFESGSTTVSTAIEAREDLHEEKSKPPKHLATVWDYQANYGGELYTVRWESELLSELCDSVADLAFDVVSGGTAQILRHTALSTLLSAFAWPLALVNAANMIDGTWTLAVERSDEAGKELARSLLFSRAGHRPVTLVGYSFGARTIYSCLKELARYQEKWEDFHERNGVQALPGSVPSDSGNEGGDDFFRYMREPASIVEDAILMGLPNHLSLSSWKVCRQVVAGRLVNCFSQKDLILSLMFQFKRLGIKPVCGTCPVSVPGVENFDLSDVVRGHQDYCLVTGKILQRVRHCQPFRSRPTRVFLPDLNVEDDARDAEKYDV